MTPSDIEVLKVYVLISPAIVFLIGLSMLWLTRWQAAREDRRAERSPAE